MSGWREVEEKEFRDFIHVLKLIPQSGTSNGIVSSTRFGNGQDMNVIAELIDESGRKTFRIFTGLENP